jgi:hypothetical protein
MATSRWCGSTDRDIRSASTQPGRIGSGVTAQASNNAASTALVAPGGNPRSFSGSSALPP